MYVCMYEGNDDVLYDGWERDGMGMEDGDGGWEGSFGEEIWRMGSR